MTTITGHVKWFDTSKGFGFVVCESVDGDILLHANVLRDFGLSSVVENSVVVAEIVDSQRGKQISRIIELERPAADLSESTVPDSAEYADLPLLAARVKWFDKAKGFGFVNSFGSQEDIFLHVEILRAYGMAEVLQGEAVAVKISDGPRGKMVVEVRQWDFSAG